MYKLALWLSRVITSLWQQLQQIRSVAKCAKEASRNALESAEVRRLHNVQTNNLSRSFVAVTENTQR